jgi:hypothetical protein
MFGLAVAAAVASMALLGASSAMAEGNTALCTVHQDPCLDANLVSGVHMVAGITTLQTSVAKVLCLSSLAQGTVETDATTGKRLSASGKPLGVNVTALTWSNCGTNAAHNNCTVNTLKGGLIDLLRTALNLGTATILGSEVLVECNIGFTLHCVYGGEVAGFGVEGAGHNGGLAGNGMFNANALEVQRLKGLFCPEESKWTALYESLTALYGVK